MKKLGFIISLLFIWFPTNSLSQTIDVVEFENSPLKVDNLSIEYDPAINSAIINLTTQNASKMFIDAYKINIIFFDLFNRPIDYSYEGNIIEKLDIGFGSRKQLIASSDRLKLIFNYGKAILYVSDVMFENKSKYSLANYDVENFITNSGLEILTEYQKDVNYFSNLPSFLSIKTDVKSTEDNFLKISNVQSLFQFEENKIKIDINYKNEFDLDISAFEISVLIKDAFGQYISDKIEFVVLNSIRNGEEGNNTFFVDTDLSNELHFGSIEIFISKIRFDNENIWIGNNSSF